MKVQILKGDIIYSRGPAQLETCENGWLVAADGQIDGVYPVLPQAFEGLPVQDYSGCLILPGLVDLHIHAPQYSYRGTGMDLELLEWLAAYTFPEEAKFRDLEYARASYSIFAAHMKQSATTRAAVFSTIHRPATLLLMDLLEESGLCTLVGKVNMDRSAPDSLREETQESVRETIAWLQEVQERHYVRTRPILTPRFIPSCSDTLMEGLKAIQGRFQLPLQSHLSENPDEIAWVQELCPWSSFYGDAYDHFGLFGGSCPTIMAHCVYSGEAEIQRMAQNGVFIAHCPESNANIASGIAPIRRYLKEGLSVGLGSDVAGGSGESIFSAMAHAIRASKLRWRLQDSDLAPLTAEEAFYLGTKGGGRFFGRVGSFEPGYEFDAVVLDEGRLPHPQPLDLKHRLERMIYLSDDRDIRAKYVQGRDILAAPLS